MFYNTRTTFKHSYFFVSTTNCHLLNMEINVKTLLSITSRNHPETHCSWTFYYNYKSTAKSRLDFKDTVSSFYLMTF